MNIYLRMVGFLLLSFVLEAPVAADLYGAFWGASAAAAVPEFLANEKVNSFSIISTAHGRGVQAHLRAFRPGTAAEPARLFVAVTAPVGSVFERIWLRGEDNLRGGYVRATLYRQPIEFPRPQGSQVASGPPQLLGEVTTSDVTTPTDGYQLASAALSKPIILELDYTYYIEIFIQPSQITVRPPAGVQLRLTAYDVGLGFLFERNKCFDGIDNDLDGRTDCQDPDCLAAFGRDCI